MKLDNSDEILIRTIYDNFDTRSNYGVLMVIS